MGRVCLLGVNVCTGGEYVHGVNLRTAGECV